MRLSFPMASDGSQIPPWTGQPFAHLMHRPAPPAAGAIVVQCATVKDASTAAQPPMQLTCSTDHMLTGVTAASAGYGSVPAVTTAPVAQPAAARVSSG